MTLNRNVVDYHAQIEQAAFEPNNIVPGTGLSPDKMLLARGFSYSDAHRARLGVNYKQIPVNEPHVEVNAYSKDGAMRIRNATDPVYAPNSMGGPEVDDPKRAAEVHWASDGDMVRTAYTLRQEDDDWGQPGTLVREVLDDAARDRLAHNIIGHVSDGVKRTGAVPGVRVLDERRPRSRQEGRGRRARPSGGNGRSADLNRASCRLSRAGMIKPMSIEVVFTAESTATGGGRDGHVKSTDGRIDLDTRPPKEMGGSGEGTNPEQLFSAGYAACFLGALRLVARNEKIDLDDATGITAQVGFGKDPEGGFGHQRPPDRLPAGPRAERRRGADGEGARRVPVLQGHPRQHRRQAVGEGLVACARRPRRRRSGRRSGCAAPADARPSDPGW